MELTETPIIDNTQKINKISNIIEFEIQLATNQISSVKKDNINIILLFFALIGFLVIIPIDVFVYEWFRIGLFTLIGYLFFFLLFNYSYRIYCCKALKGYYDIFFEKKPDSSECSTCDKVNTCPHIADEEKNKRFMEHLKSYVFGHFLSMNSTFSRIISIIFFTIFLSYFFNIETSFSLYKLNIVVIILLILELIVISAYFIFNKYFIRSQKNCGDNLMNFFIILLILISFTILLYGFASEIPPFIFISNSTQIPIQLFYHSQNFPSLAISLIIFIYQNILYIVMLDHFNTSLIVVNLNEKISGLIKLKSKINLFQLDEWPTLEPNKLLKEVLLLKMSTYNFVSAMGLFIIPFQDYDLSSEELIELCRNS